MGGFDGVDKHADSMAVWKEAALRTHSTHHNRAEIIIPSESNTIDEGENAPEVVRISRFDRITSGL